MKTAAIVLVLAGVGLSVLGVAALAIAPPQTWDSRDVLVLSVALAGLAFALVGARRLNDISKRTM